MIYFSARTVPPPFPVISVWTGSSVRRLFSDVCPNLVMRSRSSRNHGPPGPTRGPVTILSSICPKIGSHLIPPYPTLSYLILPYPTAVVSCDKCVSDTGSAAKFRAWLAMGPWGTAGGVSLVCTTVHLIRHSGSGQEEIH